MPAKPLGPRLWLQPARLCKKTGAVLEQAVWCVRDDGGFKRSTGCAESDRTGAQSALARYILTKDATPRIRDRDPSQIKIAQVLAIYSTDCAMTQARPKEVLSRIERLGDFFGDRPLSDINGHLCREYVRHRKGKQVARRELEDLRAAIKHHWTEGLCRELVPVVLPPKGQARERWLTRPEAARLVWSAWRMTQRWKGQESDRRTGRHVARFILVGLYTGTRAGAICNACFEPDPNHGFVDLERGVFYRRAPSARETKKRQTPCPIPPKLLAHMRRWKDRRIVHRHVVEWNGEPVGRVSKAFRRACVAARLSDDVTPHTLRHTAATWLLQSGVEAWEVAGFLGMTTELVEEVYGHHSPHHLQGARDSDRRPTRLAPKSQKSATAKPRQTPTTSPTEQVGTNGTESASRRQKA